ncbi:MAG: sulfatase-like hydrolase/transferase [Pirellulales bacterium]|nr:sulfatase-like hydrolase/transferase [Pirellulales bacterium]
MIFHRYRAFNASGTKLLVCVLLLGLPQTVRSQAIASSPPNIVIILADDQGIADVASNPHATPIYTPNLDRLAEDGIRFSEAYANGSMCTPSRAALLTGRYQHRFGIYTVNEGWVGFPKGTKIAPQYFKELGYTTAIIGKWHLGGEVWSFNRPENKGFDRHWYWLNSTHDYWKPDVGNDPVRGLITYAPIFDQGRPVDRMQYLTREIGSQSVRFIEESIAQDKDKPFFLYVAHHCPHVPLHVPKETWEKYESLGLGANAQTTRAMYDELDASVGMIIDKLEALGIRENTLIIYSSDNGGGVTEAQLNWPFRGGKFDFLEGGIRIPTIVSWPDRLPAGRVYREPMMHMDLLPTALAAAASGLDPQFDGVNLLPYMRGERTDPPHETLYWCESTSQDDWAIRDGDWVLVYTVIGQGLFNVREDPEQINDLRSLRPDKLRELKEKYAAWARQTLRQPITEDPDAKERRDRIRAESQDDPLYRTRSFSGTFGGER